MSENDSSVIEGVSEVIDAEETNEFADLAQEILHDDDGLDPTPVAEVTQVEESVTPQPQEEGSSEQEPVVADEEVTPEPQEPIVPEVPEVVAPAQPEAEASPAGDETQIADVIARAHKELEARYALSEDEAELVGPEMAAVLPKLTAKLATDIYSQMGNMMRSHIPNMVAQVQTQRQTVEKNEAEFFKSYPELNKPEYREGLGKLAVDYRKLNPDMAPDVFAADLATLARVRFKVPPAPVTPPPPVAPAPVGFRSPPGVGAAPTQAPQILNEFEEIADDFD